MQNWKETLPICFGSVDKNFGGHPIERANAREMLRDAINTGVSLKDIEDEAKRFLSDCDSEHVNKQMKRIRDLSHYFD